jgi:ketosteroid isomerase-like protein
MVQKSETRAPGAHTANLDDEAAITRVLYQYVHALDYGNEAAWVDCFTADAVWHAMIPGVGKETVFRGQVELFGFAAGHTRPPELYHKHVITAPMIEVDGDSATSVCYFQFMAAGTDGVPILMTFGRYLDAFRRCDDGKWRISDRHAEVEASNPVWAEIRDTRRRQLEAEKAL